jgi:hypothetical protein
MQPKAKAQKLSEKTFDLNVISIILARTDTAKLTRGKGFVLL